MIFRQGLNVSLLRGEDGPDFPNHASTDGRSNERWTQVVDNDPICVRIETTKAFKWDGSRGLRVQVYFNSCRPVEYVDMWKPEQGGSATFNLSSFVIYDEQEKDWSLACFKIMGIDVMLT